jgi:hypothetical protein
MTQPIPPWRRDDTWPPANPDGTSPTPAPTDTARQPPPATAELPVERWPRKFIDTAATRAASAQGREARDIAVQQGLDSFLSAMAGSYRVGNVETSVATPFRMSNPYPGQAKALAGAWPALRDAAASARPPVTTLDAIESGRGTPEDIHRLTQSLIDRGCLLKDPYLSVGRQIRIMMFEFGIGIDCAGYVQQAYLRSTGVSRKDAGFASPLNESLSGLAGRGYVRITDPSRMRPGDLVVLGPRVRGATGHRAIVYDQRPATDADLAKLRTLKPAGPSLASPRGILVVEVDSSWGCDGNLLAGGVRRETWWYSQTTGLWGWHEQAPTEARDLYAGPTPVDHPFDGPYGIFRGPEGKP